MSAKDEVLGIIDESIEQTKRNIEWFEKFGSGNQEGLIKHAINLERLETLKEVRNDLTYGIRW